MAGAQARLLPNGRLHLQHGPIDLVIEAACHSERSTPGVMLRSAAGASRSTHALSGACFETPASRAPQHDADSGAALSAPVRAAYDAARTRFTTLLAELCDELPALRSPAGSAGCRLEGPVARRMHAAVRPFAAEAFITPMAAVAGAVADEILRAMLAAAPLRRALVNNGGDVAVHLAPGESTRIGLVDRPDRPSLFGTASLSAADGVGGIATSGWRGRSFSRGIADAVTVLARTAAEADAAATMIANAVDLPGHPAVLRMPARDVQADSDLGDLPVTRGVEALAAGEIEEALASGMARAEALVARGLICGAALHLQGRTIVNAAIHHRRHAEEAGLAGRLEARTTRGACFETRTCGPLLSMTPSRGNPTFGKVAA